MLCCCGIAIDNTGTLLAMVKVACKFKVNNKTPTLLSHMATHEKFHHNQWYLDVTLKIVLPQLAFETRILQNYAALSG